MPELPNLKMASLQMPCCPPSTSASASSANTTTSTSSMEPGGGGGGGTDAESEQSQQNNGLLAKKDQQAQDFAQILASDDDDFKWWTNIDGDDQQQQQQKVSMENFALIKVLGKGAYGKVFLVRKVGGHDSGRYYAMKVLKKTRVSQKQKTLEHTMSERKVLERLKGLPFLVNMVYAFQTDTKLHIVMEFVRGGELFTHLCKRKKFDMNTTRGLLAEMTCALQHVHAAGVIYRDLKLENILLDDQGHVKLTDFGLSKAFEQYNQQQQQQQQQEQDNATGDTAAAQLTKSYCGTIEYMPPEIVRRQPEGYGQCADWWSFGVIAFELLTGCSPFTVDGNQNSTEDIARRILTKKVPYPKWMDRTARDFIGQLLNRDPKLRLGARGAAEVKKHQFFDGTDWEAVERRQTPGPIKPSMAGCVADVENFAAEFTAQTPLFSPADKPPPEFHTFFSGYSFVSPSVIFASDNVIGQECLESSVRLLSAQSSPFFANYRLDITAQGLLGKGSFSICRKCERIADGRQFAVKIVSQRFAHQARREVRVLEALQPHSHIVPLVDAMSDAFHHYIVLELLGGGELLQRLRRMEKFTELQAAEIMAQLVAAVKHMHDRDIVHRDLKPENILFERDQPDDAKPRLRLVDFGFARILPRPAVTGSTMGSQSLITPLCGTLHFAAPEVLDIEDELPQYNEQCDLWSLGVVLFTMLSGKVPFHAKSQAESAAEIIARIRAADFSFSDPVWSMVSQSAKDLITGLLTVDPTRRLSLAQLGAHPWLQSVSTSADDGTVPDSGAGGGGGTELPTPTILPSSADATFNATLSAFLHANREGFQLMDVQTAPLLVKRRGMKRQRGPDTTATTTASGSGGTAAGANDGGGSGAERMEQCTANNTNSNNNNSMTTATTLCTVSECPELTMNMNSSGGDQHHQQQQQKFKRRPTTLNLFGTVGEMEQQQQQHEHQQPQGTPNSAAFTEYRDTKPPYLKYSRDDFTRAECGGSGATVDQQQRIGGATSGMVNDQSSGCSSLSGASTVRLSNDSNESQ
ncbi:hypothetical protein niasHT_022739 [Heterodera trifolii]|uniref:non-specific serine/threonine protein kinase n=1 Tax=Heterodera trifolii TaxID=157864 RepID=A0ABD2K667_9BILA